MYQDFDTKYVSAFGLLPEVWIGIIIILFAISIIMLASLWKIFRKAEKPGWASLIPIYNIIVLFEIANLPKWQVILLFIPVVNFYVLIQLPLNLAKVFHMSSNFGLGLMLLPMFFYPVLAFNRRPYIGINKDAGVSVSIDPNAKTTEKDIVSTAAENVASIHVPIGMGNSQMSYNTTSTVATDKIVKEIEPEEKKEVFASFKISSEALLGRAKVEKVEATGQTPVFLGNIPEEKKEETKVEVPSFMESFATLTPVETKNKPISPVVKQDNSQEFSLSDIIPSLPEIPDPNKIEASDSITNPEYVICSKCGAKIKKGATRCFLCGKPL